MSATSVPRTNSQARRQGAPAVRWQRQVPRQIRALDTLTNPDYTDAVVGFLGRASDRSPEEWLRAAIHRTPRALRPLVPLIQGLALGLRLDLRPGPDRLLGWKIAERGRNWVRMEAAGWFLTGHVVFHVDDRLLTLATFVRYDRPVAAVVWPPVSLVHRQAALELVRGALRA